MMSIVDGCRFLKIRKKRQGRYDYHSLVYLSSNGVTAVNISRRYRNGYSI